MAIIQSAALGFGCLIGLVAAFNIPIPFGNIDITKGPDGSSQFGINSGLNINGHGAESGLKVTSKNGSIQTQTGGNVLVGGNKFGTNSTLGIDKQQGLTADTDVNVGQNQTLHGGLGKEGKFIGDLANVVDGKKKNGGGGGRQQGFRRN